MKIKVRFGTKMVLLLIALITLVVVTASAQTPTCQDPNATNFGRPLPCTYPPQPVPPIPQPSNATVFFRVTAPNGAPLGSQQWPNADAWVEGPNGTIYTSCEPSRGMQLCGDARGQYAMSSAADGTLLVPGSYKFHIRTSNYYSYWEGRPRYWSSPFKEIELTFNLRPGFNNLGTFVLPAASVQIAFNPSDKTYKNGGVSILVSVFGNNSARMQGYAQSDDRNFGFASLIVAGEQIGVNQKNVEMFVPDEVSLPRDKGINVWIEAKGAGTWESLSLPLYLYILRDR